MRIGHAETEGLAPEWVDLAPVKDGTAKPFRWWRRMWPYVRFGARLARWWLAPFLTAGLVLVFAAGSVTTNPWTALVVALSVPAAVIGSSDRLRGFYARFPTAAAVAFYELFTWPYLCGLAGFVQAANGRLTYAELRSVVFRGGVIHPDVVQVEVVPVLQHERSTWDRYEDRIGRYHKAALSFWEPAGDSHNAMRITIRRQPLPTRWALNHNVGRDRIGRQVSNGDRMPLDTVYFGLSADGSDIVWHPDESGRGSLFIGGRKGGGKGEIVKAVLCHGVTAEQPWRFTIVNPKKVGEFRWVSPVAVVEKEPAAMFAAIAAFRAEMERRANVLDEVFGVANYLQVPLTELAAYDMAHRECLIIDELVVLANLRGAVPPPPKPEGFKGQWRPVDPFTQMHIDLNAITAMDRAMGMSSIVMTQHPIAEHLGPFGSTLKSNLGGKFGTGYLEAEGAAALFGKSQGQTISDRLRAGIPGRQIYEGLATNTHGRWQLGQGLWIGDAAPSFLPDVTDHRPRDFAAELDLNPLDLINVTGVAA